MPLIDEQTETEGNGKARSNGDEPQVLVPFTRGSRQRIEPFHDATTAIGAASRRVGPEDVLAHGFLRHILLEVTVSNNGAGGTPTADAPFSVLDNVTLSDVNGNPVVQLSGYELFLANKYGAYAFMSDARKSPSFSNVADDGSASFMLRVPVEISGRDALGALKNQNASQTYKLSYVVAPSDQLYDVDPGDAPQVTVRAWLESWTQPKAQDMRGNPIATMPPAHKTTQFWSTQVVNTHAGRQTIRFSRVGNHMRCLLLIARDAAGARSTAIFPDQLEYTYDGNVLANLSKTVLRHRAAELYDLDAPDDGPDGLDSGVFIIPYHHDLDGRPGFEMRDRYLPTTQGTDLSIRGEWGNEGSLIVATNDVAAAGGIFSA